MSFLAVVTNMQNSDAKVSVASNPQDPVSEVESADDENSGQDDDDDQDNDDQFSDSESPEESEDEEPTELSDQNEDEENLSTENDDEDSSVAEHQGLLQYSFDFSSDTSFYGKLRVQKYENDGPQQHKHMVTNTYSFLLPLLMLSLSRIHFTPLLVFVMMEKCLKLQTVILFIVESLLSF